MCNTPKYIFFCGKTALCRFARYKVLFELISTICRSWGCWIMSNFLKIAPPLLHMWKVPAPPEWLHPKLALKVVFKVRDNCCHTLKFDLKRIKFFHSYSATNSHLIIRLPLPELGYHNRFFRDPTIHFFNKVANNGLPDWFSLVLKRSLRNLTAWFSLRLLGSG